MNSIALSHELTRAFIHQEIERLGNDPASAREYLETQIKNASADNLELTAHCLLSLIKIGTDESLMSPADLKRLIQDYNNLLMIIRQHIGGDSAESFALALRIIQAERQLNLGQSLNCLRTIGNIADKTSIIDLAEGWQLTDPALLQIRAFARQGDYAIAASKLLIDENRWKKFASRFPSSAWEIARHTHNADLLNGLRNKLLDQEYPVAPEEFLQKIFIANDSNSIRRLFIELCAIGSQSQTAKAWLAAVTKSPGLISDQMTARMFRQLGESAQKDFDSIRLILRTLHSASTSDASPAERVAKIAESNKLVALLESHELRTLTAALSTRILLIFNQLDLAAHQLNEYRAMSRRASNDTTNDILNCFTNIDSQHLLNRHNSAKKSEGADDRTTIKEKIPIKELAALFGEVGLMMTKGFIARTLLPGAKKKKIIISNQLDLAQALSRYLRKRRGAIVKIGQLTAHFSGPIAESLREDFEILRIDVNIMKSQQVRAQIQSELDHSPEQLFRAWNNEPFALGSLGQVHQATCREGNKLAVKIQYNGVSDLIETQMNAAKYASKMVGKLWKGIAIAAPHLAVIHNSLNRETDYQQELRNTDWFRDTFQDDPEIIIPQTFPELCSERILSTEYIEGVSFGEFRRTATQEQRDRAGTIIARMAIRSMFEFGNFNTDIQPDNLIFTKEAVAFIDFGSVWKFSGPYLEGRNRIISTLLGIENHNLRQAATQAGFIGTDSQISEHAILQIFGQAWSFALKDQPVEVPPDYAKNLFEGIAKGDANTAHLQIPQDMVFAARLYLGTMSMIHTLGARVHFYKLLKDALGSYFASRNMGVAS